MSLEDRLYEGGSDRIVIDEEVSVDKILDIGGGGEGIIGQCYGSRVIAIDPSKEELEEAPKGPLQIVMDAKELLFLDESFSTVTSFFTLMYIKNIDHKKVFKEIYRVLRPHGEFILWDAIIPKYHGGNKDIFVIRLQIDTPMKTINTGYGTKWTYKEQSIKYFIKLGQEVGFKVKASIENNNSFKINFKK